MKPTRHIFPQVLLALVIATGSLAHASPCDLTADTRKVHVRNYKAVGDGKTDDGPAIRAALKAVIDGPKPASLEFDAGKTYRITTFEETYALRVLNAQKVTLHGNGAELLLLPPNKVLRISDSSDVNVCGLTVDYSPLPFTQGIVVSTNPKNGTFDVEIEDGFDVPEVDSDSVRDNSDVWEFAMPYKQAGKFERRVDIKTVHAAKGKRQVRIFPEDIKQYRNMIPGETRLAMPIPGKGQVGNFAFQILNNERIHIEGLHVFAIPQYAFYIANNQGAVHFVNVEERPRPGTARVMAGWRDVFHVKDNRTPILWDGCYVEGAFDDAFNLSAMYQLVVESTGLNSWRLRDLGKDGAPIYKIGDRLQAIDIKPERKLLGEAKILAVTQRGQESVVTLSAPLPLIASKERCKGEDELCGSRVVNLDAANEGSIIRNCTINGSMRLRSKTTLERSKLDGFLQIANTPAKEGPLPEGVIVQDNELSGTIRMGSDFNTKEKWDHGERWVQNVVFRNNLIHSSIKAHGASFNLINNDFAWPKGRKLELSNCGPVGVRNLKVGGRLIGDPLKRFSVGRNMSLKDVIRK